MKHSMNHITITAALAAVVVLILLTAATITPLTAFAYSSSFEHDASIARENLLAALKIPDRSTY